MVENSSAGSLRYLETGGVRRIELPLSIGCDGARSVVRKAIGAGFPATPSQRVQSTYIRAPELIGLQRHGRAWAPARQSAPLKSIPSMARALAKFLIT